MRTNGMAAFPSKVNRYGHSGAVDGRRERAVQHIIIECICIDSVQTTDVGPLRCVVTVGRVVIGTPSIERFAFAKDR
ncbi:hypothetical protein GCM10027093_34760 [Paraburkholderia jirisanensis]